MKKIKFIAMFIVVIFLMQLTSIGVFANTPSDWAKNEVNIAIQKGLVPEELQSNYSKNITRQEFCKLCTSVMKAWSGEFQYQDNLQIFDDCSDKDVLNCAKLEIVSGVGSNKFAPQNPIKRQEAARMLYNTLNVATPVIYESHGKAPMGFYPDDVPHSFNDGGLIKNWARKEINNMYRYGVMLGVSNNNYEPDGYYTREQAICTFLRLFYCFGNMENNSIQKDYFPNGMTAENYVTGGAIQIDGYDLYDKENYTAQYIDNEGNVYSQEDKGYVYPFDMKYSVVANAAPGLTASVVLVDKDGNKVCQNGDNGWDDIQIFGDSVLFSARRTGLYRIYKIPKDNGNIENNLVAESDMFISYLGNNLYSIAKENNRQDIIDLDGNYIFQDVQALKSSTYNNIFIVGYKDGQYGVIKKDGSAINVLKKFDVPDSWDFVESVVSNINFYDGKNDKHIFYRAVSGKQYEYNQVSLTNNNESIVYGPYYHYYILNSDGSVKFDAGKLGYKNVKQIDGFDLYQVLKDNGESGLFDIVDKNGKIIKKDVNNTLTVDKSGICAYYDSNNIIHFFDFFGDDIVDVNLANVVYSDISNKTIYKTKFIKGLLWVTLVDKNDSGNSESFYVMPNGQIINLG